jgi:hypothetical protein
LAVQVEVSDALLTSDAGLLPVRQFDERIGVSYATWLDATKSADGSLLRPYPAEAMTATAVNTYVSNGQHQGPECIAAVGA